MDKALIYGTPWWYIYNLIKPYQEFTKTLKGLTYYIFLSLVCKTQTEVDIQQNFLIKQNLKQNQNLSISFNFCWRFSRGKKYSTIFHYKSFQADYLVSQGKVFWNERGKMNKKQNFYFFLFFKSIFSFLALKWDRVRTSNDTLSKMPFYHFIEKIV